jgi:hypothetical protein
MGKGKRVGRGESPFHQGCSARRDMAAAAASFASTACTAWGGGRGCQGCKSVIGGKGGGERSAVAVTRCVAPHLHCRGQRREGEDCGFVCASDGRGGRGGVEENGTPHSVKRTGCEGKGHATSVIRGQRRKGEDWCFVTHAMGGGIVAVSRKTGVFP